MRALEDSSGKQPTTQVEIEAIELEVDYEHHNDEVNTTKSASGDERATPTRKFHNMQELCSLQSDEPKVKKSEKFIPLFPNDRDFLVAVACAYLRKKKAVLVFCPTKSQC